MRLGLAVAAAFLAQAVSAQSVKLEPYEVTTLLSGNTAIGQWDGADYRQYFAQDGTTIFAQSGSPHAQGKWRVTAGEYQSRWDGDTDWQGWFVMEYAGQFFWVSKATPPTPFTVVAGNQLIAQ